MTPACRGPTMVWLYSTAWGKLGSSTVTTNPFFLLFCSSCTTHHGMKWCLVQPVCLTHLVQVVVFDWTGDTAR